MLIRAALLLAAAAAALPQDPPAKPAELKLTLKQAVHMALANGLDIEIARYQPWIDDGDLLAALGAFDHVAYATLSDGNSRVASTNPFGGATIIDGDTLSAKGGLKRALPLGLTFDLFWKMDRSNSNSTFATFDPQFTESFGATVTMPILKGRGEHATYAGVVIAKETRRIDELTFERTLTDQVLAVHKAYWDFVFALEQARLKQQSLGVANKLLDETRMKFDRGTRAKVDVTEAESGVAGQVEGIITAENAVQDTMDRLKRLIDPSLLRRDVVIVPVDAPVAPAAATDEKKAVEEGMRQALARRADYRAIAHQLAIQDANHAKAKSDGLPRLDFTATGNLHGTDDTASGSNSEFWDLDTRDWALALSFELPIEGRAAAGAMHKADLERRRLEFQRRNLEDNLLLEVREAVRALRSTEKRIDAAKKAAALAQEQLDGEMNRREQGLRTTFHVLDAEKRRTEAGGNSIKAHIDYQLALQQFHKAGGLLLERNDVLVADQMAPRAARP